MEVNCARCGGPGTTPLDIHKGADLIATAHLCPPCMKLVLRQHAEYRRQYEELIAAGVEPQLADRIMNVRVEQDNAAGRLHP